MPAVGGWVGASDGCIGMFMGVGVKDGHTDRDRDTQTETRDRDRDLACRRVLAGSPRGL